MSWLLDREQGLSLRRLQAEDLELAAGLAERSFQSPSIGAEIRKMLHLTLTRPAYEPSIEKQQDELISVVYYVLVRRVEDEEVLVGLSGLYRPCWAGAGVYWLGWFAVDPQQQHRGYGAILLHATLVVAAASGGRMICVETSPASDAALHLYEKLGFLRCGEVADYWEAGLPLVVLARTLTDIQVPSGGLHEL